MLHETSRGGPSAQQQALSRFADRMRVNRRTYDDYPGYIVSLLRIKKACAIANAEAGALDPERARAIASACDGLADGGRFPVDTFVDAYPLLDEMLNTAIAERASRISGVPDVCPDRHVGLSQGGRDVIATADTLFIHDALEQVFAVLPGLEHALMAKGDAFRNVLVMGRETLRDTLPVSLSHVFEGYGKQVRRARLRLEEELPRWNTCALGASVAGTGFGCAPGFRELACKHLSAACGRRGAPMLPPTQTRWPACSRIFAIRVVVVVLPSEPVTAMMRQGQTSKNASISLVSSAPFSRSRRSAGISGCIPGVRKTISACTSSR